MGVVTRRAPRLLLATGFAFVLGVIIAAPASGHAVLESTSPSDGQLLATGQSGAEVRLRFGEPVEIRLGAIKVLAGDGHRVDVGQPHHPAGDSRAASVELRANLSAGSYLVMWRVISADSHPVAGSFTFAVGHIGAVADAAASSGTDVPLLLSVARFFSFAGIILLIGSLAFLVLCWPAGWAIGRARLLVWSGLATAATALLVSFGLQAAYDADGRLSSSLDPTLWQALLGTRFGHADLLRLASLAAVALVVGLGRRAPSRLRSASILSLLVAIAGTLAMQGHAASEDPWLRVPLDTLHVLAASVWLGGLAMLVGVVLPSGKGNPQLAQPVRRFSVLAFSCVGALVVTGTIQAWRQVGELPALTGTHYGELLLLKVGLLGVVLLFAAASRAVLRRRGALRTDLLGRSVTVESAVGVVVVAVTAVLVATTPAKVAYRPTATRTLQAGPVTLELSAVPQGAHTIDLHLYSFGASRLPIDLAELHGDADRPGDDFGPVSLRLQPAGTGHFVANRVLLPSPGTFTVTFYVRTGQFDSYSSSTHLTVR